MIHLHSHSSTSSLNAYIVHMKYVSSPTIVRIERKQKFNVGPECVRVRQPSQRVKGKSELETRKHRQICGIFIGSLEWEEITIFFPALLDWCERRKKEKKKTRKLFNISLVKTTRTTWYCVSFFGNSATKAYPEHLKIRPMLHCHILTDIRDGVRARTSDIGNDFPRIHSMD